ncbi:hypothetical protein VFPPC_17945 [Pochonia chlamydosporia 170]|uniref:Uncharacterized protein n=1 Tax=Pochonia chlamydosporia 170 TaxID=1380566 RepID=A0A219AQI4_METCM|nr:hypothetical protein VFPPC_17945 [Pochonia chlamydosporia 170]OWT42862.1 hypothetical protein VFPPC_17945 [Pochonia chlamydosporia 170]
MARLAMECLQRANSRPMVGIYCELKGRMRDVLPTPAGPQRITDNVSTGYQVQWGLILLQRI